MSSHEPETGIPNDAEAGRRWPLLFGKRRLAKRVRPSRRAPAHLKRKMLRTASNRLQRENQGAVVGDLGLRDHVEASHLDDAIDKHVVGELPRLRIV